MAVTGRPVVVVHGGAGDLDEPIRDAHVEGAKRAAAAGLEILRQGGSALDAAQRAVEILEDDPLFNAATGGALTEDGTLELDAALMEGTSLRAGAVAGLPPFAHPIAVARSVLDDGRHVLLVGGGAAAFATRSGHRPSTLEAMRTEHATARWRAALATRSRPAGEPGDTVGAVACDAAGRVAAATSTGGTTAKRAGRVGDSPLIGSGTYADDLGGACSATGIGEGIIRVGLARMVCAWLAEGRPAKQAAASALAMLTERVAGSGGLIVVDRFGEVGTVWNTATMTYAVAREGAPIEGGC